MRKPRILFALMITFALMFSAAACSSGNTQESQEAPQETPQEAPQTDKEAVQFPLKFTDFVGREVTIEKQPQKIVSLAPSITELIYALGAGDMVVGVTDYDNYPPEVQNVPKVGDFNGPNMEAIAAQAPDIIFASTVSGKEQMEALEEKGTPVAVIEARNIDEIYQSLELMGQITGTEEKAQEIIQQMQAKIKEINDKVKDLPKVKVFYVTYLDGNWTGGKGTFVDELITLAGGENIAADVEGWVQYSLEELINKNPDVIIMSASAGNIEDVKTMEGYKDTNAAKNDRVYKVSNDDIVSRASNRIVLGLEEFAKLIHPEVFE